MIRHIVGLSGGKDSTAMALRLRELNPDVDYDYICTPTGNELPDMFAHWEMLERLLGKRLIRINVGLDLYQLAREQKMLPNHRARFCTRILKIEPTIEFMRSLPQGSLLYVGLRADEEERKGIYSDLVTSVFPMREWGWGIGDVWHYLHSHNITIPRRTDCDCCFHQRLGEWWDLWKRYPDRYAQGADIERELGYTLRSDSRDQWPASLAELAVEFERGRIPQGAGVCDDMFGDDQCRVCSL